MSKSLVTTDCCPAWLRLLFPPDSICCTLLGPERARLQTALESILMDRHKLHAHICELQRTLGEQSWEEDELPDDQTRAILNSGLTILDDAALVSLALNPNALYDLFDNIFKRVPGAWLDVMAREGETMYQAAFGPIPSLGDLLSQS